MFGRVGLFHDYHADIIDSMSKREYAPNINGMCLGIAYMGMQAVLADDLPSFDTRIKAIGSMKPEALSLAIDSAKQKRLNITTRMKKAIGPFRALNPTEMASLDSQSDVQRKIKDLEITLRQLMDEQKAKARQPGVTTKLWDEATFQQEFDQRKKQLLFNALVQNRIEMQIAKLPMTDQIALDIDNFFDAVKISFAAENYKHLYPSDSPMQESVLSVSSPILSVKQERRGGIELAEVTSGIYNKDELTTYLECLRQTFKSVRYPVGCILGSGDHAISINYDDTENKWVFIDANKLPSQSFTSDATLAEEIIAAFFATKEVSFSAQFYSGGKYVADLKKRMGVLNTQPEWHAIHDPANQDKVNKKDDTGNSWLYQAAKIGQSSMVEALLQHNAAVDITRRDNVTPLYIAAQNNHINIVTKLLNKNADPNILSSYGTALSAVAITGASNIAKILLDNNAAVNVQNKNGCTPLWSASFDGHLELVNNLLQKNADPNIANNKGLTPVAVAAQCGHLEVIKQLITKGADINVADNGGFTPLMYAVYKKDYEMAKFLIANQADVNASRKDGRTALSMASGTKQLDMVKLLQDNHATRNKLDTGPRIPKSR